MHDITSRKSGSLLLNSGGSGQKEQGKERKQEKQTNKTFMKCRLVKGEQAKDQKETIGGVVGEEGEGRGEEKKKKKRLADPLAATGCGLLG